MSELISISKGVQGKGKGMRSEGRRKEKEDRERRGFGKCQRKRVRKKQGIREDEREDRTYVLVVGVLFVKERCRGVSHQYPRSFYKTKACGQSS